MDLSILPKEIEKIILNYKHDMEHYEKYKHVLGDIKNNLSIKYLVPFFEYDTGYLCKTIDYKDKPFQKFCSVICNCCGRQIHKTLDEYGGNEEEIKIELNHINNQLILDAEHNDCVEIKDYSLKKYHNICERLEDTLYEELDEMDEGEIFEILFELGEGELEDFIFEEYSDDETDE